MTEILQKYELLILFSLTTTDEELKSQADKIEQRLKDAGASIHSSTVLSKGKLAYEIGKSRQGYYHTIQFEADPEMISEFRNSLQLAGETVRFSIVKVKGDFKEFIATPQEDRKQTGAQKTAVTETITEVEAPTIEVNEDVPSGFLSELAIEAVELPKPAAEERLSQKKIDPSETKVSMEEIDRKLEQILEE